MSRITFVKKLLIIAIVPIAALWWVNYRKVSITDYEQSLIRLGRNYAKMLFYEQGNISWLVKSSDGVAKSKAAKLKTHPILAGDFSSMISVAMYAGESARMELESYQQEHYAFGYRAKMVFRPRAGTDDVPRVPGKGDARIEIVAYFDRLKGKCVVTDFSDNFNLAEYLEFNRDHQQNTLTSSTAE